MNAAEKVWPFPISLQETSFWRIRNSHKVTAFLAWEGLWATPYLELHIYLPLLPARPCLCDQSSGDRTTLSHSKEGLSEVSLPSPDIRVGLSSQRWLSSERINWSFSNQVLESSKESSKGEFQQGREGRIIPRISQPSGHKNKEKLRSPRAGETGASSTHERLEVIFSSSLWLSSLR